MGFWSGVEEFLLDAVGDALRQVGEPLDGDAVLSRVLSRSRGSGYKTSDVDDLISRCAYTVDLAQGVAKKKALGHGPRVRPYELRNPKLARAAVNHGYDEDEVNQLLRDVLTSLQILAEAPGDTNFTGPATTRTQPGR